MLPDPERNGPEIAAEYLERFPDGLGVMQPTGDGYLNARWYCGSPWFGRGWIDRAFGGTGPIPTGYRHNWADMELHWASRGLGRLWQRPDLTQRHEHFARESDALPPAYWSESAAGFDRADCERFIERAWAGFPGCEPVGLEDDGSVDGGGPRYDPGEFSREYRSIAEVHLHALTGRCAWDACRRARQAMDLCLRRGWNRVAVYGNGAHTGAVWTVLADSGVRPVVILDDRADETGERFGVPVRPPEAVRARDVDAVVLSGNSVEDDLLAGAERLGRPVVRLYGEASPRVITPGGVPEDRDDAPPAPFSARAG